jgi:tetratricopeptide (TPR) repeat protein
MASREIPPSGWIRDALEQGFAHLNDGRPDAAAAQCRRILDAAPELTEAHFLVGLVALEMRDRRTALSAFGSVTRLRPRHGAAWAQLARLFMQAGQANRADRALAEAMAHESGDPVVQDLIGNTLSLLGDQAGAREWYARAVAGAPDRIGFRVNLANAMIFTGDIAGAEAELGHALALAPDNAQAHWLLSGTRKARDRTHVETLVRLAARPGQPPQALAFLFYALGKELEDLQEWDRAFEAFARGAAYRHRTVQFDEAAEHAMYTQLEQTYTPEWLRDGPAVEPDAFAGEATPIFVVGQPRTGTTLVERIIAAHSQVHSAGELQQFGLSVRRLVDYRGQARFSADLMRQAAGLSGRELGQAYLKATTPLRGKSAYFVDKLPSNFLYVPLILKALPQARIVHLVRDPMDACFASFKQLFADAYPHSYDQAEQARHFARYHHLMARWHERFPGRVHDVRYEDIASDPEPHARALLAYLGLTWEDQCLLFHQQQSAVATASAVQVREPPHTRSIGRWRRYADQLQPMCQALEEAGVSA